MIADDNHDANTTSQNGIGGISLILSNVMFLGNAKLCWRFNLRRHRELSADTI